MVTFPGSSQRNPGEQRQGIFPHPSIHGHQERSPAPHLPAQGMARCGSASLGLLCDGARPSWGQEGGPHAQAESMERSPAHPASNAALNTMQLEHTSSGLGAGPIREAGKTF